MTTGDFLLAPPPPAAPETFPENFSGQRQLIAQTAERFAQDEIAPASDRIESQDFAFIRGLLKRAGNLGLTAVDVPEEYGGLELDSATSALVADHMAVQGSFSVAFGAHVGIATLPLVYFGTDDQKRRYLPRLASAEWIGAYALSESGSGSDALALRSQAVPTADGSAYILNGEKMWISNAGFADLFTVFAKIGDRVSAFLVEAATPGVSTGAEEHKMGILGSSTRPLLLRDARIPAVNLLGKAGEGAHIAFQILNVGRFKLGAACLGGARNLLRQTVAYARERHAFGKEIAQFGLVRQMIVDTALGLYASESMVYRTAAAPSATADAVECAIVKVDASEMLDRAVDRAVQIHGGNGFIRGNVAERAYRDARVNRIFEGTNEINRLLIPATLLRNAQRGTLGLLPAIEAVTSELLNPPTEMPPREMARKTTLLIAGLAFRKHGAALAEQQEILAAIADLSIATYRLQSIAQRGAGDDQTIMNRVIDEETLDQVELAARRALAWLSTGDDLRTQLAWLRRLLKRPAEDTLSLRRRVALRILSA
jgi:alkylation response protein AidB-like acyl-CoA dehydrogenase